MRKKVLLSLLILLLIAACGKDDGPELTDWRIIETNTNLDINGIFERDGQLSILGKDPRFTQRIEHWSGGPTSCLLIRNHLEENILPLEIPIYATLSSNQRSWETNDFFKTNIIDVQFISEQVGFVQTQLEGLFKTTNAGATWTQILEGGITYYCRGKYALHMTEVHFKNEDEGYVIDNRYHFALKTVDGGKSWEVFADGSIDQSHLIHSIFTAPDGESIYWRVGQYGGFRKSTDQGINWSVSETETAADDIQFLNDQMGFFVDEEVIYKTIDGGTTWNKVSPEQQTPREGALSIHSGITHLTLIDENSMYVHFETIESTSVYYSTDGGVTFQALSTPASALNIKGIYPAPSGKTYAYGANGLLMELR